MIKNIITASALTVALATTALADYTLIVPQNPGQGTSVWAEIIAKNLSKFTNEPVVIRHIPGARDIPGFNKFASELRFDEKTIMVAHGGNGVSFLLDDVDYNYFEYDLIGSNNNDIVLGKKAGADEKSGQWKIAGGSGYEPDGAAMAMLLCGPQKQGALDAYIACWRERAIWVNGVKGGEKRLGFMNGEFDVTRESPAAWNKFYIGVEGNELWFTHGILDANTASHMDDPNYPNMQFEILFKNKYGVAPSGEFYDAYKLVKSFRDGMQKALWVRKDNPNAAALQAALTAMSKDPKATANIQKKVGKYEWKIGTAGNQQRDVLMTFITKAALRNLVKFNTEALGLKSVYKANLVK